MVSGLWIRNGKHMSFSSYREPLWEEADLALGFHTDIAADITLETPTKPCSQLIDQ